MHHWVFGRWQVKVFVRSVLAIVLALMGGVGLASAQSSSGVINGRLVDQSGAAVVHAQVQLVNQATGVVVKTKVQPQGTFLFLDVQPGDYTVSVTSPGYKTFEKKNLRLSSQERLNAGTLTLEVGEVTQAIEVSAANTPVQTTSSEISGELDTHQLDNLLSVGRDFMSMLKTVPGVVGGGDSSLGTSGTPTINGQRNVMNSSTVDGVSGGPRGGDKVDTPLNLDAIQEVKVQTSNFAPEYGAGTAGPVINLVTKSGTQQFHGTLYYYVRNEAFNANGWFNNYHGQTRPRYRYNDLGGNIGGPIYWPGRFNTAKNKLFFFYSQEYLPNQNPEGLKYYTVPTALERKGDFSQTYAQGIANPNQGDIINIKNPASSGGCPVTDNSVKGGATADHSGCFSGNVIPSNLINPSFQALLNLMPLPNFTNRAISQGKYNYITNYTGDNPVTQEIFRVDYDPTDKLRMFFRGEFMTVNDNAYSSPANKVPWLMRVNYQTSHPNLAYDMTYAFSPTLLNELVIGTSGFGETQLYSNADLQKATKSASGYNISQLNPANNPLDLLPAVSFGGVTDAATYNWDSRFPMYDRTRQYQLTDSLSKSLGEHNLKFGVNLETDHYLQAHSSSGIPEGSFSFSHDTKNPNDSNYAYSNALLGNFDSYSEPTSRDDYNPRIYILEGYAQDQWRITHKLTLDYGARFAYARPPSLQVGANFVPSLYDPTAAPTLYQYGTSSTGATVAVDPTTGKTYPAAYVGLYVPGTGNLANGMITTKSHGYPEGLVYGTGVQVAPRFGFAYDVRGDGKTAIRGGFGVFINPATQIGQEGDMSHNPPIEYVPTQYYGNVNSFLTAGGLIGPSSIGSGFELHPQETKVYNASLGIQQEIGFGTVLGIAYVGNVDRHLTGERNINEVPYGAHFLPQNWIDPKDPGPTDPTQPFKPKHGVKSDNFFRPFPGYSTLTYRTTGLTSNYHSMQVTLTRRLKNGLEFGLAYTWSRAMDYADSYDGSVATYQPLRSWDYGPASWDHRNNLVINYVYTLPKASQLWNNFATREVLDGWQISGFVTYLSGAPDSISYSITASPDISGGGDGTRVHLTGNPDLRSPHSFNQWFDTSVVQAPSQSYIDPKTGTLVLSNGVSPKVNFYDPGYWDMDTAVFKNFLVEQKFALQLRLETYNTLNSAQFNGVDSGATFTGPGAQAAQTSGTFGQINSTAGGSHGRVLQLAGRINF